MEKSKNNPIVQDELDKSKNLLLSVIFRAIDNPHELCRIIAFDEIHFEKENVLLEYTDKIKSITKQGILEVANKYFQDKKYVTAILKPKK